MFPPPTSTLFPYTTLFRSQPLRGRRSLLRGDCARRPALSRRHCDCGRRRKLGGTGGDVFVRRRSERDRKSTRLNSSHLGISYAVFCLKKKKNKHIVT